MDESSLWLKIADSFVASGPTVLAMGTAIVFLWKEFVKQRESFVQTIREVSDKSNTTIKEISEKQNEITKNVAVKLAETNLIHKGLSEQLYLLLMKEKGDKRV